MAQPGYNVYSPDAERIALAIGLIREKLFSKQLFTEIGFFAQAMIKKRTSEGKDVDGQEFEPYSAAYAKFRRESGHPANKVNLFFTGSMMSAMSQEIISGTKPGVKLFFLPTQDDSGMSNPAKAYYLNKTREFFALSDKDIKTINKMAEAYYNRLVESIN